MLDTFVLFDSFVVHDHAKYYSIIVIQLISSVRPFLCTSLPSITNDTMYFRKSKPCHLLLQKLMIHRHQDATTEYCNKLLDRELQIYCRYLKDTIYLSFPRLIHEYMYSSFQFDMLMKYYWLWLYIRVM